MQEVYLKKNKTLFGIETRNAVFLVFVNMTVNFSKRFFSIKGVRVCP